MSFKQVKISFFPKKLYNIINFFFSYAQYLKKRDL